MPPWSLVTTLAEAWEWFTTFLSPSGTATHPSLSRVKIVPVKSISLLLFCPVLMNEVILQNTPTFVMISRWLSGCHIRSLRYLSALVLVNVTTATDQMEGVYNFGDFCIVLPRCLKSFPDVPTLLCFTTYAPSWLFWKVYYSQEILLPLHNAWTCHFYIRYGFHIYFLKKAGLHVLLWSWSNDKKSIALNTTRCYNANVSKVRMAGLPVSALSSVTQKPAQWPPILKHSGICFKVFCKLVYQTPVPF